MCYSFDSSVISFSIGLLSAIFAFATKQYILGCLIFTYSQMQLSEAIIWKGIDKNSLSLNRLGTNVGKYSLPLHNIAIGVGILISLFLAGKNIEKRDFIPLLIGVAFYILVLTYFYRGKYASETYPAKPGSRLKWPYPHAWYAISFIISIIFLVIYGDSTKSKIFLATLFSITFIICLLVYPKSVGSVWCFAAAILSPIIVSGNYLLLRK